MRQLTEAEWLARGEQLYGKDLTQWKFRCVRCGHVQSFASVKEHLPDMHDKAIKTMVYFSCEGRWNPNVGCDWTLGGLFAIHKLEVISEETGKPCAVFEFADDPIEEAEKTVEDNAAC